MQKRMKIIDKNRQKIIYDYAEAVMGDMNWSILREYAHYGVMKDLEERSDDELLELINEYYPHLLDS